VIYPVALAARLREAGEGDERVQSAPSSEIFVIDGRILFTVPVVLFEMVYVTVISEPTFTVEGVASIDVRREYLV
jgi:hypothetical protein